MNGDDAQLTALSRTECLVLLAWHRVGRLVLGGSEARIYPLNYAMTAERVVVRVASDSGAARSVGEPVLFEVDVIDDHVRAGWSVVVRGTLVDVTDDVGRDASLTPVVEPWVPGPKDRWLVIPVEEVSGRWARGADRTVERDERGYL